MMKKLIKISKIRIRSMIKIIFLLVPTLILFTYPNIITKDSTLSLLRVFIFLTVCVLCFVFMYIILRSDVELQERLLIS